MSLEVHIVFEQGVADKTIAEDSDDDIFGDIGDYVPPKEVT